MLNGSHGQREPTRIASYEPTCGIYMQHVHRKHDEIRAWRLAIYQFGWHPGLEHHLGGVPSKLLPCSLFLVCWIHNQSLQAILQYFVAWYSSDSTPSVDSRCFFAQRINLVLRGFFWSIQAWWQVGEMSDDLIVALLRNHQQQRGMYLCTWIYQHIPTIWVDKIFCP